MRMRLAYYKIELIKNSIFDTQELVVDQIIIKN